MSPADPARIKLLCQCGVRLAVPATAQGRRVRCPKCKTVIVVGAVETAVAAEPVGPPPPAPAPSPSGIDDLLDGLSTGDGILRIAPAEPLAPRAGPIAPQAAPAGPARVCPSCRQSLPSTAKICVACGIDLKSGRAIEMHDDSHLDSVYTYAESIIRVISFLFFAGLYPITSEAFGLRKPWVVRGIAILTIAVSVWYMVAFIYASDPDPALANLMQWNGRDDQLPEELAALLSKLKDGSREKAELLEMWNEARGSLGEFHAYQWLISALLHADPLHLLGNLLFLMVFGTRINALIGNVLTLVAYPLLAIGSGIAHGIATEDGPLHPSLGASGAIMGLAGMYFVLLPISKVHMAAWWRWGLLAGFRLHMNIFPVRGLWVVLFYIAFDVIYTAFGMKDNVAHWAHLGGFIFGAILALVLLFARLVNARGGDILSTLLGPAAWALIGPPNRPARTLW